MRSVCNVPWTLVIACAIAAAFPSPILADHLPPPVSVTIAGSLQDELGCSGDWQPDCAATHLSYDGDDDVWQESFDLPAGSWEYKAALNDSWDLNFGANAQQDGPNIPLALASPTTVKFYYSHQTHWITDNVNSIIATVPGSFQSALGCPGDWQPDCLRSWLQDPDGDGVYGFTTDAIPAGDYEAKVAHDESWAVNFGQDGIPNGPNIPFSVPAGATVSFEYDAATHILDITVMSGGLEPGDEELIRPPLRTDFSNEVFYFVLPDRFSNGDASNDFGGDLSGDPLVHGYLPSDRGYYHGGDLSGLTGKLDYLQDLGITAIWMTPQYTNRWVQGDGTIGGSSAAYHGYWQTDFTQIDPHFGTNEEMSDLIDAAHSRGMKVFFDIVTNHTADVIRYEEGLYSYRNKTDYPYRDAFGTVFDDRDFAGLPTFPPLDAAVSFPYTPAFISPEDATAKNPAWLNDPTLYHNRGDSSFAGENTLYGDFFGLDDLFTEHPDVVDGMIAIHQNMISEFGIDGFRVDTVKHVNDEFWERFVPEILAHAESLGNSDFTLFGEVFDADAAFTSRYTTRLPFPSVLDFGFEAATERFSSGDTSNVLRDFFEQDDHFTDADSNVHALVTFTGNHDIGRIGFRIDTAIPGAPDAARVARSELAHALMFFSRGVPSIYYGDEQGFVGDGGDRDARQDMLPSLVPSYNDDDLMGTAATTADDNFDSSHPLYLAFSDFATVRDAHAALRQGAQIHRYSQGSAGIYAFSRIVRTERIEYVVALNNSEGADSATFSTYSPSTTFTEIYPGGGSAIASDAGGFVTVFVPGLDVRIYRAETPAPDSTGTPGVMISTPEEGAEVLGVVEVRAELSRELFAEVSFAVSVDGGDFEVLGTDDNPPYRIFYDVSGHPGGTVLRFKAIVDDLAEHYAADDVTVTVGAPEPVCSPAYAIIHYFRDDGDYGDHTTGDYNDYWGLHLWGDIEESISWTAPKPFLGEDGYGRFAWVKLQSDASNVGFIVHRGDVKDGTSADRFFDPGATPEIWLRQDDPTTYTSHAEAKLTATIHYHRDDGDYGDYTSDDYNNFWGLHLWGGGLAPGEVTTWTAPRKPDALDDYGPVFRIALSDPSQPVNFIVHRGDLRDPAGSGDRSFEPLDSPMIWLWSDDLTIYDQRGAAESLATLHYHRDDGDYGDYGSSNFEDFWGLHVWTGAASPNPSWFDPLLPDGQDTFGIFFHVPLLESSDQLAYILHRGDDKDPGPDQFLNFAADGYEVWQLENTDPDHPYILPVSFVGGDPLDADCSGIDPARSADPGECSFTVPGTGFNPTVSGGCSAAILENDFNGGDTLAGETFPVGDTPVTWTAVDDTGTADSCAITISITDDEPPTAVCQDIEIPLNPSGTASIAAVDIDGGSSDACGVAALAAAPDTFTSADVGPNSVTLTVTDTSGNVDSCTSIVTVAKRPTTLISTGVFLGQYSDRVSITAVLTDDISGAGVAGQIVMFTIGSQIVSATTDAAGVATAMLILEQPPTALGFSYTLEAIFAGDDTYDASGDSDPFTILREDARVTYSGAYFASTAGRSSGTATVTLAATIQDITAAVGDPAFDPYAGDIRNARVTFVDRMNGDAPVSPALPVVLIDPGVPTTGSVVYNWQDVDIGNADSESFEIGIVVDHYYWRNDMADNVMVTVSRPLDNFVTGGGYIALGGSAGSLAGDSGSKANFGLNAKFNPAGNNIKGKVQMLVRRTEPDGVVHTYRIKSNKLTSMAIAPILSRATVNGKCNIVDVTDPLNPISIAGNRIFQLTLQDNGNPGSSDLIGFTVYDDGGGLVFSNDWTGTETVEQALGGGNIKVLMQRRLDHSRQSSPWTDAPAPRLDGMRPRQR